MDGLRARRYRDTGKAETSLWLVLDVDLTAVEGKLAGGTLGWNAASASPTHRLPAFANWSVFTSPTWGSLGNEELQTNSGLEYCRKSLSLETRLPVTRFNNPKRYENGYHFLD
jgi:hypothetical protein